MNLLDQVLIALRCFRRKRQRSFLSMRVDRAPDPKTLDSVGRDRLQTHIRTRADIR